jgi:hypothetical protein
VLCMKITVTTSVLIDIVLAIHLVALLARVW